MVRQILDDQIYAVKQIELRDPTKKSEIIKEIKSLLKVESKYVVKYYGSWEELTHVYIQMEYCSQNLMDIIELKPLIFCREPSEPMDCYEYFISCEIFLEILKCVQYLHELKPQIIHRDLKPQNILIAENVRNGRFIKLCDFGLATDHKSESAIHTTRLGTSRYKAPEVDANGDKAKYTTKADIFSLENIWISTYIWIYMNTLHYMLILNTS
ncbi:unnamed protein product, partial [Oppiella nova]